MGWKLKALVFLFGLALLTSGAWPLSLLCFLYLFLSQRRRSPSYSTEGARTRINLPWRQLIAAFLLLLSGIAFASGGMLSPLAFFAAGAALVAWPSLVRILSLAKLVPVEDTILLRSKYMPMSWCALAELKPGADQFPMGVSSFGGTILVFTDTGKTYSLARCFAFSRREAEERILTVFRLVARNGRAGVFLLPLDASLAADVLRVRVSPMKLRSDFLPASASKVSGLLTLECSDGRVRRASAFEVGTPGAPALPGRARDLDSRPLTWEVFDAIGKRTRWPEPDRFSDLLYSMVATKGVPLAERVRQLESSGDQLTIRSLSGDEVQTTRPQLRAIVSIYS